MSTFFLISIIVVCAIVIIKLLFENNKLKSNLFNNDDQLLDKIKTRNVSDNHSKRFQDNSTDKIKINSEIPSKNAFLHGADSFGEMKKGVVLDGKTYTYDNEKGDEFKIQSASKKRRNKK
jgi:predicted Holliday junction resolvase-like endonuclease